MYKRDYRQEAKYQARPEQVRNRMARNRARARLMREGLVHKGDNMDVDHRVPLIKGGGTGRGNLRVRSESANRSFRRTRGAHMA
jgi:hypothetical protein